MRKKFTVKITPIFRWYNLYIGIFVEQRRKWHIWYFFFLPTLGIKVEWGDVPRPLYYCDAERNIDCPKSYCYMNGGECRKTPNKQFKQRNPK